MSRGAEESLCDVCDGVESYTCKRQEKEKESQPRPTASLLVGQLLKETPAAAALPIAWRVDRPLLPSRHRPAPEPAASPKPSEDEDEDDTDWFSIFCSTCSNSCSTSL